MNSTEHLLTCTAEEGAEIAVEAAKVALDLSKVAHKTLRFGLQDRNVLDPTGPTNTERLVDELNDLLAVADMLTQRGILPANWQCKEKQAAKKAKVLHHMKHAEKTGALQP